MIFRSGENFHLNDVVPLQIKGLLNPAKGFLHTTSLELNRSNLEPALFVHRRKAWTRSEYSSSKTNLTAEN